MILIVLEINQKCSIQICSYVSPLDSTQVDGIVHLLPGRKLPAHKADTAPLSDKHVTVMMVWKFQIGTY